MKGTLPLLFYVINLNIIESYLGHKLARINLIDSKISLNVTNHENQDETNPYPLIQSQKPIHK